MAVVLFWKSSVAEEGGAVFASLILACPARCGFCGGGPFATSTVLLRLSGYGSSGVPRVMRCWQILATCRLFLGAVHYWPTEGHLFTAKFFFLFSFPYNFPPSNVYFSICLPCVSGVLSSLFCIVFASSPVQTGPGTHAASYTMGPWVKQPGRGANHPPPSRAEVKERVELYLYYPSVPWWQIIGWPLSLPYHYPRQNMYVSHYILKMLITVNVSKWW
jgi:hypothetical protein